MRNHSLLPSTNQSFHRERSDNESSAIFARVFERPACWLELEPASEMYNATRTCEPAPVQLDHVQAVGDTGRRVLVSCAAGASGWCSAAFCGRSGAMSNLLEMKEDVGQFRMRFR